MSVLFIQSFLPPQESLSEDIQKNCYKRRFARFFLEIIQGSVDSLLKHEYKKFDALVKNFGCQITALEVQQLVLNPTLREEAKKVCIVVSEKVKTFSLNEEKGEKNKITRRTSLVDYLKDILEIDLEVSPEMMRLTRLYFLCLVNANEIKNGREVPVTNIDPLLKPAFGKPNSVTSGFMRVLVNTIQMDESKKAAEFIRLQASQLEDTLERRLLIQRMLSKENERENSQQIHSLPLLYNTEAVINRLSGVILIKNKCFLAGKPIEGAQKLEVYLLKKGNEIQSLADEEIAGLSPDEPLFVIEGYVEKTLNREILVKRIEERGLLEIVRANCASISQYADRVVREISDEEASQDIKNLASLNLQNEIFEIDHMFCASVKEEQDV